MAEPSYEELKAELERVRKERDGYHEIAVDLLKRHHDIDLDELEAELRDWKEKGAGIPFSQVTDMLKNEFGIIL
jgi:uncharacterized coiled-coil DUF342 family protein